MYDLKFDPEKYEIKPVNFKTGVLLTGHLKISFIVQSR